MSLYNENRTLTSMWISAIWLLLHQVVVFVVSGLVVIILQVSLLVCMEEINKAWSMPILVVTAILINVSTIAYEIGKDNG